MMLNTEVLWNKALTDNNVRGIIRRLHCLTTKEDKCCAEKDLASFRCWLHRSVELTKKELLTLCFGQCDGFWIFLDQSSYTKLHLLIQKLKNLLLLARLGRKHADPLSPTFRLTCRMCCADDSSMMRWGCLNQDHHTLRQHILLGRLVQWWSLTGLLPQYPDARELKQISQMWRKMDQSHKRTCLNLRCDTEDKFRLSTLIQDIVAHIDKEHGPLWVSEDCAYQTYPPPSLQALLNLVLIPHVDITSFQAIIIYFVLDVSKFLHCKDDLLQSFCYTFSIPHNFLQQIYGFWLLDHDFVSNAMDLLLSPKTGLPRLLFQHCAVLRNLLRRGEQQAALKYLYYNTPAIENIQDAKLCVDVLLQNNRVSEAWRLLRQGQPGNEHLLAHFIHECEKFSLSEEALATVCKEMLHLHLSEKLNSSKNENMDQKPAGNNPEVKDPSPRPLSALLYRCLSNDSLTPGDLITFVKETVTDLTLPQKPTRTEVVWPKYLESTEKNRKICLSDQAFHHLSTCPSPVELQNSPQRMPEQDVVEDDVQVLSQDMHDSPALLSSGTTSPDSMASTCSFISAPSSPPGVRSEASSRCGSILPLQNPFTICTDENIQMPIEDQVQIHRCPDLTLTLDGATEAMPYKSLRRESAIELDVYELGVEEILMCAVTRNVSDENESPVVIQAEKRTYSKFNLPPQFYSNEDNQAVPSTVETSVDSHNFLMPDYEKIVYDKVVSEDIIKAENVTEQLDMLPTEHITENGDTSVYHQDSSETSSLLELKPLRRALSLSLTEESSEVFHHDSQDAMDQPEILTSCALTETMQDLLEQIHEQHILVNEGEQSQSASLLSLRSSIQEIDFNPKRCNSRVQQLKIPLVGSLSPRTSPIHSPQLSTPDQTRDKPPSKGKTVKEAVCFKTTADRVGHCKLGNWWKQALETRRASTGLLPAVEQIPAVVTEKSATYGHSQSQGPVSFRESSTKSKKGKKEVKQTGKEESTSRKGSSTVACHPVEQRSSAHTGGRRKQGKRFKRA